MFRQVRRRRLAAAGVVLAALGCAAPSSALGAAPSAQAAALRATLAKSPHAVVTASLQWDQPLSAADVTRNMAGVKVLPTELRTEFRSHGQEIAGGIGVRRGHVTDAVTDLYRGQRAGLARELRRVRRKIERSRGAEKADARAAERAIVAYLQRLRAGRPVVTAVSTRASAPAILALAERNPKAKIAIADPSSPPPSARASADLDPAEYMPRTMSVRTLNAGDRKETRATMTWTDLGLTWYQDDDHHDRGFEVQAIVDPSTPVDQRWSTDWGIDDDTEGAWASNMPEAYRDDLYRDGEYKSFAVGSGDAKSLVAGTEYWAFWQTDAGLSDEGFGVLQGQATRRAAWSADDPEGGGPGDGAAAEWSYCVSHLNVDSACFFAEDTTNVGRYPLDLYTYWTFREGFMYSCQPWEAWVWSPPYEDSEYYRNGRCLMVW
jgi:hypothetical protein